MTSHFVVLGLRRPQYVALPEAFISDLAWRAFPLDIATNSEKPVGLRYRTDDAGTKVLEYRQTAPTGELVGRFGEAILHNGIEGEASSELIGQAVAESVDGLAASKGSSRAVSPLTPALALLQNTRGLMGVRNPPGIAEIIEQMYAMGREDNVDGPESIRSATGDWIAATQRRMDIDPLLFAIDAATSSVLLRKALGDRSPAPLPVRTDLGASDDMSRPGALTPFGWFRRAWQTLTSDEWVDALPARTWADWATTVLRLAYGLGYLWESAWYESVARRILLEGSPITPQGVIENMDDVVPWRSSRLGVKDRDVAPLLMKRSFRADRIRQALRERITALGLDGESFDLTMSGLQGDGETRRVLKAVLRTDERPSSGKNLWEASRYALMTRATDGSQPDYFGLLRSRGRFLVPDPGTEWVAVVASLTCGSPGGMATVAEMLWTLSAMGVRPELSDLVELLERAGLARGSADADQAVLIQAAY
ncbi:hypothetical protein [Agromyces albus]|uniref:hypothetical protein n=1 Tax=Agromyces albus TaxID=205332 RepID=UPI00278439BD|nr:hypothetical protein [Agromyces albus]MDQ0576682.1 hypothetical protein [Agromyces albus]